MKYTIIKRFITFLLLLTIVSVVSAENATPADTITTEAGYIQKITNWYSANMNYYTVAGLMAIESSFIPFPSEIVVPPAAAVSVLPGSKMNSILIILFATLGSLIGALVNYFLSMTLGRTIIYKFADSKLGHLCLLNSDKIRKAENYFNDHGKVSTFIGRLIPGIRQLISIPAGLARMPLFSFMGFTVLGAGIWNVVLALIGYIVGDNMDLIYKYSHEIGYLIIAVLAVVLLFYTVKYLIKRKKQCKQKNLD